MLKVIRGATCAENTPQSIANCATALIQEILSRNCLNKSAITAIFFTATQDLDAFNPATAVRTSLDLPNVAFMCAQEMQVAGTLPHCLRVAVFVEVAENKSLSTVYLGAAQALRPDLK